MTDQVRSVRVRLSAENASYIASMRAAGAETKGTAREMEKLSVSGRGAAASMGQVDDETRRVSDSSRRTASDLDKMSGRMKILLQAAATLGPGLIPLSAVGIPAVSGLASQLGFAAVGAGTLVLGFQGVLDTLKAVNKAGLEPTTANLNAARVAMDRLSPAARGFVQELKDLGPLGKSLQTTAAEGLFPGLTAGLRILATEGPQAKTILRSVSSEIGDIAERSARSLTSDRWAPFLKFIGDEAPQALDDMSVAFGNTAHAAAGFWMSTKPLNDDFNAWLIRVTGNLDKAANGLADDRGFQNLIDYIEQNGPQAEATLDAVVNALVQIVQAASPLGGPVLNTIEAFANAISAIADSNLGTPIFTGLAALSLYNRALATTKRLNDSAFAQKRFGDDGIGGYVKTARAGIPTLQQFGTVAYRLGQSTADASEKTVAARNSVREFGAQAGKAAAFAGGLALVASGVADNLGLGNTASLALAGSIGGPVGTAIGATIGLFQDWNVAVKDSRSSLVGLDQVLNSGTLGQMQTRLAQLQAQIDETNAAANDAGSLSGALNVVRNFKGLSAITSGAFEEQKLAAFDLKSAIQDLQASANGIDVGGVGALLTQGFSGPMQQATHDTEGATAALGSFLSQLDVFQARLSTDQALISYRNSLRDLRKLLKEKPGGADLKPDKEGDAVRQQLLSSIQIAQTALSGLSGTAFTKTTRSVIANIRQIASTFKLPKAEVDALLVKYGLIDKTNVKPKVDANTTKADRKIKTTSDKIYALISKGHEFTITANTDPAVQAANRLVAQLSRYRIRIPVTASTNAAIGEAAANSADGGMVPKTGKPYADRHLYLLADGEEIISNRHGQADQFRADRAAGLIPGYADGGTTGSKKKKRDKLTREEYISALSDISFSADSTWKDLKKELHEFVVQIRKDGGKLTPEFEKFANRIERTSKALDRQRTKVDAASESLDNLKQAQESLVDSVKSAFDIVGIFSRDFDPYEGLSTTHKLADGSESTHNFADLFPELKNTLSVNQALSTAAQATQFASLISSLSGRGLSGATLQGLASSGNLQLAQSLSAMTNAGIKAYSNDLNGAQAAVNTAATSVGNTVLGRQVAIAERTLVTLQQGMIRIEQAMQGAFTDAKSHKLAVDIGGEVAKANKGSVARSRGMR